MFMAYIREYRLKIWPYMVQYLHFGILKFPLKDKCCWLLSLYYEWAFNLVEFLPWTPSLGWYFFMSTESALSSNYLRIWCPFQENPANTTPFHLKYPVFFPTKLPNKKAHHSTVNSLQLLPSPPPPAAGAGLEANTAPLPRGRRAGRRARRPLGRDARLGQWQVSCPIIAWISLGKLCKTCPTIENELLGKLR